MAKLFRRRSILAKAESTYGTDPTPTGTANYVQVRDLTIEPIVADEVERDLIRPYLGAVPAEPLPDISTSKVTFTL